MNRRLPILAALLALCLGLVPGSAGAAPPVPETNFVEPINAGPCTPEPGNPYELEQYKREGWDGPDYARYPGACHRLRFVFGPLHIKPGQNDVLIEPVTIQKPAYDGYIARFKPDLVTIHDGKVPPIEVVHLHHATWVSLSGDYGSGPFFAAGEEKTYAPLPRGYGFPIQRQDVWGLLYMIHNQLADPTEVYITYDIDYIAKDVAESPPIDIHPVYPVWLDVRPSGYPVFNVQRGFGTKGKCTWPKQNCARFDPYGKVFPSQGERSEVPGTDWTFPADGESLGRIEAFHGGTIVGMGGHLHPGGLSVNVDSVRKKSVKRIQTSEAIYWDWENPKVRGNRPTSWDLSMTVNGLPYWGIRIKPGDTLRINATYDSRVQSTYENMGIAVLYIAPDMVDGGKVVRAAPGLDPHARGVKVDRSTFCTSGGLTAKSPRLCTGGFVTHGHLAEADNHGGPRGTLNGAMSSHTDRVGITGFVYTPGDLGMVETMGIPTVSPAQTLEFWNLDAFANVYHTVTSCAYPCVGPTGIAFPLADGRSSKGRSIDFDSSELGYGVNYIGPAKNEISWNLDIDQGFRSGEIYTYFCRIHPFMRGAFAVE
jgi:hypothetical protein